MYGEVKVLPPLSLDKTYKVPNAYFRATDDDDVSGANGAVGGTGVCGERAASSIQRAEKEIDGDVKYGR